MPEATSEGELLVFRGFDPQYLSDAEMSAFLKFVADRSDYKTIRALFADDRGFEKILIQIAAAYVLFEMRPLDQKLTKLSGFSRKRLNSLRTDILNMATTIERLNNVYISDGT